MGRLKNICIFFMASGVFLVAHPRCPSSNLATNNLKATQMKTKKCSRCGIEKSENEFYTSKNYLDGLDGWCKLCYSEVRKVKHHTKQGLIARIYNGQKQSSKRRNHKMPTYTVKDIREWAFSQRIFHELFDNWESSGFGRWLSPSFDRIDNSKGYTLDNLQIITWYQNDRNEKDDIINGNLITKRMTPIIAIKNRLEIEYYSQRQASRELGLNVCHINQVLKGKRKEHDGYKFIYK